MDPRLFIWEALASWLIDFSILAVMSAGLLLFLFCPSTRLGGATTCRCGQRALVFDVQQEDRREMSDSNFTSGILIMRKVQFCWLAVES